MSAPQSPRNRRVPEHFGTREFEPFAVASIAGGLDRTLRRSATDPGKWWQGEGFTTNGLLVQKAGGLLMKTPLPLSNLIQGYFERGCAYFVGGDAGAHWDLFGFDVFALFAGSLNPTAWGGRFEWKLKDDPESSWTEIILLGKIYEVTFSSLPVATAFLPGETITTATWVGILVDFDPLSSHAWIAKFSGTTAQNPAPGNVIAGVTSGASETIATATDTGCVRIQFDPPGYPIEDSGDPRAHSSAGVVPRPRVVMRRLAGSRTNDIYEHETSPVQLIHRFVDVAGGKQLLLSTSYQLYQSDGFAPVDEGDCRNPSYRVGATAAIAGGGLNVSFIGTGINLLDTVWPGPVTADWLFKLDADPDTSWTPVLSVNSSLALTLRWPYVGGANGAYKLRRRWQATTSPYDARRSPIRALTWVHSLPERLVLLFNGSDPVMKWRPGIPLVGNAAVGEVQPLLFTGLSTPVDWTRYAVSFKEHLVLGYYKQGAAVRDRGIRWSVPRNCESWRELEFRDIDFQDSIAWLEVFRDTIVVFGRKNIVVFRYLGDPFWFGIQSRHEGVGTIAGGSVQNDRDQGLLFLGPDDIFLYDGIKCDRIGGPIRGVLFPLLSREALPMVSSFYDENASRYYLSVPSTDDVLGPHTVFAYDLVERTWARPFERLSAFGHFENVQEGFVDDDEGIVDADESLVDERIIESEMTLAGSYDGSVYELAGLSQDGADIHSTLATGLTDFGSPAQKRVGWVTVKGRAQSPATFWLLMSDDGETVWRSGPYTCHLDETRAGDRPRRALRRIWVNKLAVYFGVEIEHDYADQAPELESVVFWHRPRSLR